MPTEQGEILAKRDEIANGGKCQRCFQNQAHQGVVLRGPSLSNGAWLLGSNRSRHFSGTG